MKSNNKITKYSNLRRHTGLSALYATDVQCASTAKTARHASPSLRTHHDVPLGLRGDFSTVRADAADARFFIAKSARIAELPFVGIPRRPPAG